LAETFAAVRPHIIMTTPTLVLPVFLLAGLQAAAAPGAWKPELLPRDREVAAALAAGPPAVAEGAGVYVLTGTGYVLDRPSRNGFHCLVGRDQPGTFEPQCFDAEGSGTLLQAVLLAAERRMLGDDAAAVARAVADGYASGRLRAPRRAGVNYMLARENRVPVDDRGTVRPYRPHVMIYVPYLRNADFGAGPGSPVFVINEGQPGAYLIIPVPDPVAHDR
jgi:hypothetical protein